MISRRALFAGLGGTVILGVAGGTLFAATRTPEAALAPWQDPGTLAADPRVKALEWAVLSPSPHNRQPWLIALEGEDTALLYCDLDRRLPMTDPYDRQVAIGLGAFIELFVLAAAEGGAQVDVVLFPDGTAQAPDRLDDRPVARLTLKAGGTPDPLFQAVPFRRSVKEPYDVDRAVGPGEWASLAASVGSARFAATADPAQVDQLKALTRSAWDVESLTPRTHMESVDLMRIGKTEINASPDGIDLGGPFLEALSIAGLLTRDQLADPQSSAFAQGKSLYEEMIDATPAYAWLITEGNSRVDQIEAGRDYLRMNLAATAAGLAIHPMSQVLQEFSEMAPLRKKAHDMLGVADPAQLQMIVRLGYGPDVPPSPRWRAETRIL